MTNRGEIPPEQNERTIPSPRKFVAPTTFEFLQALLSLLTLSNQLLKPRLILFFSQSELTRAWFRGRPPLLYSSLGRQYWRSTPPRKCFRVSVIPCIATCQALRVVVTFLG